MTKKTLAVMLGLLAITVVAGCNNNTPDENVDNSGELIDIENIEANNGGEIDENIALTNEGLDEIDSKLFPKSYTYETYSIDGQELIDTGTYTYPEDADSNSLLPIQENMVDRNVIDSYTEGGVIYTSVDITLKDGKMFSVLYLNNAETNEYIAASVSSSDQTTLYSFQY